MSYSAIVGVLIHTLIMDQNTNNSSFRCLPSLSLSGKHLLRIIID